MIAVLDIKDSKASFVMELLDSLSFVKVQTFNNDILPLYKTKETVNSIEKDFFAEVRGIWADRDIDGKTLRNQAWGIEE